MARTALRPLDVVPDYTGTFAVPISSPEGAETRQASVVAAAIADGVPGYIDPSTMQNTPLTPVTRIGGSVDFGNGLNLNIPDYSGGINGSQGQANLLGDLIQAGTQLGVAYLQGRNAPAAAAAPAQLTQGVEYSGVSVAQTGIDAITAKLNKIFGSGATPATTFPSASALAPYHKVGLRQRNRQRAAMGLPPLHPRMNVANVHALRRAMRRVGGFAHLAKATMTFTKTHHMKSRRRKR